MKITFFINFWQAGWFFGRDGLEEAQKNSVEKHWSIVDKFGRNSRGFWGPRDIYFTNWWAFQIHKKKNQMRNFGIVLEIYFAIVHEYKFDSKFMKALFAVAAINLQIENSC